MSVKKKTIVERTENVTPGLYALNSSELIELSHLGESMGIMSYHYAFKYGFLKGQRAAAAQAKREVRA